MRARLPLRLVFISVCVSVVAFVMWMPIEASAPTTHEFTIDSADFAYTPGRVSVNQGDTVKITLTASDVVHGFALDGYDIDVRVTPGVSQQIEFVAHHAGKFRFRCSVSCGSLHPFMIGELVVTPNAPFSKASAMVIIGLVGMLGYIWTSEEDYS